MILILKAGGTAIEGPSGYNIVTTEATQNGLTYPDFAEVTVTKSIDTVLYTIADKLPVDLRIILKKKKKLFGLF